MQKSAYEQATETLLAQLEAGTIPWRKPWVSAGLPRNLKSQKEYRGMNVILLAIQNQASPYWLTFNQAKDMGGSIKKGEHGTHIMFWSTYNKKTTTRDEATGDTSESVRRTGFWRSYVVFNLMQCEQEFIDKLGLNKPAGPVEDLPAAQAIWDNYPDRPTLINADAAFYRPPTDEIGMPLRTAFKEQREYYSTLFHEMTHSTGARNRLNRDEVTKHTSFGSNDYSAEELVAEFGSCMLCGLVGISPVVIENQAAYIKNWLNKLRLQDNKRVLMQAVSAAQKACDHIRAVKQQEVTEELKEATA